MPFVGDSLNRYLCVQIPSYGTADLISTVGGTASATSYFEYGNFTPNHPQNAFDNSTDINGSKYWCPQNDTKTSTTTYLEYTFKSAVDIESMKVVVHQEGNCDHKFNVLVYSGGAWTTVKSNLSMSSQTHSFTVHKANVSKIRFLLVAGSFSYWCAGSHYSAIVEVDCYGRKH